MKPRRILLILLFGFAGGSFALAQIEDVLMARYSFSFPLTGYHGEGRGSITYAHDADQHPGIKGLNYGIPSDFIVVRDEEGIYKRIIDVPTEWVVRKSEEDWTAEDPEAFQIIYGYSHHGAPIRTSTVARVTIDGEPVMVMRSKFHGFREGDEGRMTGEAPGRITRSEFSSPKPGHAILTQGREIGGEFVAESRNTRTRIRDNELLRLHRIVDETFSSDSGEWVTSSDVLHEWQRFGSEWKETRAVYNPEGDALTEEWEYYTYRERTGPDGHTAKHALLKRHLQKDGTEVFHQYLENGQTSETRYPDGSVHVRTMTNESITDDKTVITVIEQLDGKEISRVVSEFTSLRHQITTSRPGRPDEILIREYYPPEHDYPHSQKRTIQPDGMITTWERTRLEDGNMRLVEEFGFGDGERVIEGTRRTTVFGDRPDNGVTTERIDRR